MTKKYSAFYESHISIIVLTRHRSVFRLKFDIRFLPFLCVLHYLPVSSPLIGSLELQCHIDVQYGMKLHNVLIENES
jgi:hypothetical protein